MIDNTYKKQLEAFGIESVRATEGDIKRLQKAAELEAMINVVKALMDNIDGRQWIYTKLDMCGVFTAPIAPGDSHGTHVLCGIQSVGHAILNDVMRASPENFPLMLQEAAARAQNYQG
jgi:hypothetical protein